MTIGEQLGVTTGNSSQTENKVLAEDIALRLDTESIAELFEIASAKSDPRSGSAINVIGEVGLRSPELLAPFVEHLLTIGSQAKGLRLWESTGALASVARYDPELIAPHWLECVEYARTDSVIARDNAVKAMCALAHSSVGAEVMPALLAILESAPINQFPSYAEQIAAVAPSGDRSRLVSILERRISEMPNEAKSRRVSKVIQRIS